ncbi:MAG: hypothetical protein DRP64_10990 [Verrucomicrobia bacterium]|nr:MAG: hypothetical protein DRP64_10990 [Verrucomicrobiota bacterium]
MQEHTQGIDIDAYTGAGVSSGVHYRYIKLVDVGNDFYPGSVAGADINAVGAISTIAIPPPPIITDTDWQFNTLGDTEGWTQATLALVSGAGDIAAFTVTNAFLGTEIVLASQGINGNDPQLIYTNRLSPDGEYWSTAEIRVRQLDLAGTPLAWDSAGCAAVLDNNLGGTGWTVLPAIGGVSWDVQNQSDDWIVATISISSYETNLINGIRFDPVGQDAGTNKNFEVDYIKLTTTGAPPPLSRTLAASWEFNATGDTEGFTNNVLRNEILGVTVTNAINGSEMVLTSEDVEDNALDNFDPQIRWSGSVSPGNGAWDEWDTLEFRIRQLSGNPGEAGTTSTSFALGGTLTLFNSFNMGGIQNGAYCTVSNESDGWITVVYDISSEGSDAFTGLRIDPFSDDESKNFEVDWIRVYSMAAVGYGAWTAEFGLTGTNAVSGADSDGDLFNNFYEYAFGGNPTNALVTGLNPVSSMVASGGSNVLEYVYYRRAGNSGVDYSLESSTNLLLGAGGWSEYTGATLIGSGTYNDEMDAVTNLVPINLDQMFIRTKAVEQ